MLWRRALLLLFAIASAGLPAFAQHPQPQPPPAGVPLPATPPGKSLLFGINVVWGENGGTEGWDRGDKAQRLATMMKAAGVTNLRITLRWADMERARGKYDWRATDKFLRFLRPQGFVLTCVVEGVPDWASDPDPAVHKLFTDQGVSDLMNAMAPLPQYDADLGRFAYELASRYKGLIRRWEFWNAPDGRGMPSVARDANGRPTAIRYGGDPLVYTKLLSLFTQNIKRADPASLVAIGGLATPRTDFLQALYANGARKFFDAVCLHPDNGPHPLAFDWVDACRAVLVKQRDEKKKFWLTEWGWNTYPGEPGGIVEGEQAKRVRAAFAGMQQRPFIEQANLHTLNDWRTDENDPLSLVSRGLFTRDLQPKPAYAAFRAQALGLAPKPDNPRRLTFLAQQGIAPETVAHLEISPGSGTLTRMVRGVTASGENLPAKWSDLGARLAAAGATLVRLAPFNKPGTVTFAVDGMATVNWESVDATLQAVAQAGGETILDLTPPRALPPAAWGAFVAQVARRYGGDPKYGVARWELATTAEDAPKFYPPFAQAARAALPTTPIGFLLTSGDAAAGARSLAKLCMESAVPCDSFGWKAASDPTAALQALRRVRAALAAYPALKTLTLWPESRDNRTEADDGAARFLAWCGRQADDASPDQSNPLGGALVALSGLSSEGRAALALLNRVTGVRLRAESDDSGARCLAARSPEGILSLLLWREDGEGTGLRQVALRLRGLPPNPLGGLRMEIVTPEAVSKGGANAPAVPGPTADLPPAVVTGAAELPLALPPRGFVLLRFSPHRPAPLQLELAATRGVYFGGDEIELIVTARNRSKTPVKGEMQLRAEPSHIVPPDLAPVRLGMLAPGAAKAVRYLLRAPTPARDMPAYLEAMVGEGSRAVIAVPVSPPLLMTLDTPQRDLDAPGEKATFRLRLTNRAKEALPMTLRVLSNPARLEDQIIVPGGGKPVLRAIEIAAPSRDPGMYPVDILAEGVEGLPLATIRATLGVPLSCRYAAQPPTIDGDLSEWADAEPIGMGRREQVHEKEWRGPGDLSAYAYCKWDATHFYFACAVTDDVMFQPYAAPELWRGDSVQFALSLNREGAFDRAGYGPGDHEFGLALLKGTEPTLYRFTAPAGAVPGSKVAIRREGTRAFYEASIPWTALTPAAPKPGALLGFSVLVNDDDGQGHGYIEWGNGLGAAKRPGHFPPLRLIR